jgi:predicted Zn-dependent protease
MMQKNRLFLFPILLLLSFILAFILGGCAVNPVSGRHEVVLVSVADEKKIGAENAKQVKEQMGLIDDPALLSYVQAIGDRLAEHSPYREVSYQFQIVDSPDPNAFALPGGYVYVNRGLLVLVNSEDELAGVIGHEIGHVAARHSVQRITRAAPVGVLTGVTAAAASIFSPSLANAIAGTGNLLNSAVLAPYSREQENDADAIGQQLAAKASWDPEGIAFFLKTLDRATSGQGEGGKSISFLSTHPSTPDRIQRTEQRSDNIVRQAANPIAKNHQAFLAKLDGLMLGADAKQGVFVDQDFLQPTMQFGLSFPSGWETTNQPQFVAAINQQQNALIVLELQGKGNEPMSAAQSFLSDAKLDKQTLEQLTIGGLPASRAVLEQHGQQAIFTWIAFQDQIYRFTGVSKKPSAEHRQIIENTAATFHLLTAAEMTKIKQQRLRIVPARAGESLEALLKRAGSNWNEETCAIANNLQTGALLNSGQLVKVAIPEPFQAL